MSFTAGGNGGISSAIDIALSNPADNEHIAYNTATQKWHNKQSTVAGLRYVGTNAVPVTDPVTARPTTTGPVYWICASGDVPANARTNDLLAIDGIFSIVGGASVPSLPTNVSRSTTSTQATVSWTPPSSSGSSAITHYRVSRDGFDNKGSGPWSTDVSSDVRTFTFMSLLPGASYNLSVAAVSAAGVGPAAISAVTIAAETSTGTARPLDVYPPNGVSHFNHPQNSATRQYLNSRCRHDAMYDGTFQSLWLPNVSSSDYSTPGNSITIRVALEVIPLDGDAQSQSIGTRYQLVGSDGSASIVVAPGTYAKATLPTGPPVVTFTKGQAVFVRTFVDTGAATNQHPIANFNSTSIFERTEISSTDKTMGTGVINGTTTSVYAAQYMEVRPTATTWIPMVQVWGDSVAYGSNRSSGFSYIDDPLRDRGIPHVKFAQIGELASSFRSSTGSRYRNVWFTKDATDVTCSYGINDLNSNRTLSQLQADVIALAARAAGMGARFHQTTLTPKASSTDNWATADNQTPNLPTGQEAHRLAFNAWLRDGAPVNSSNVAVSAGTTTSGTKRCEVWNLNGKISSIIATAGHPFAGVIDAAARVTVTNSSGHQVWAPGLASDSFHPTNSGHTAMASVVDAYAASHFTESK